MGWFWASAPSPAVDEAKQQHIPSIQPDASKPSGCPVRHLPGKASDIKPSPSPSSAPSPFAPSSCPVRSKDSPFYVPPSSSQNPQQPSTSTTEPTSESPSTLSKLNPLNYMFPSLSQSRAPNQTIDLPVEREISSIPRGPASPGDPASYGSGDKWEYPSPQQMYNALLRKGYSDTPQDAVEAMVAVHNFLNEGAWEEIVRWERTFAAGLGKGWERCRRGEENLMRELEREEVEREVRRRRGFVKEQEGEGGQPSLVRFMGRPQERTPKASLLQALGWVYPAKFGTAPPFDRHDWYVLRQTPSGPKEVRYVIDYYSGEPEPTGEPVFYLDIRPAVDTPTAAVERLMRWGGDVWWRASGGEAREAKK
ncbi:hypothetical protein AJ79_08195 [Helicocarpus griseus UAMH5409]|uniref:Holocytochrome c-type synthase n=1 Tax=Helicocarpus griseus UAMH5409 TaxID=1447875 RepID=A0A2B7WMB5_9EURO|nr:hypothetical protein AJ79_08195 [Helicocarpus griseus UAMH5409]